jgi:hypothetical protein
MTLSIESQLNPMVNKALAFHAFADPGRKQQINRVLFEDSRAYALLHVLAAAAFKNDGINSTQMQQVRKHETCRACAYDPDLRSHND